MGALGLVPSLLCAAMLLGCQTERERDSDDSRLRGGAELLWDLPGEVQEILLEPDPLVRAEQLAAKLRTLGPQQVDDVLVAYDTVFLDVGEFELELLAEWWATFDPQAAWEWVGDDWRSRHPRVQQAVLRTWARDDPKAALKAAETEPLAAVRRLLTGAVLRGWEEGGTPGALEFVENLGPGHDRQRLLSIVVRRKVLRDGVDTALKWVDSRPGPFDLLKLNLVRRAASAAAEVDPEKAAAWAEQYMKRSRSRLPQRVATRWIKQDPEAAMQWLSTLEPGVDRDSGVKEAYRVWLRYEPQEAHAWLMARDHEAWLDEARALHVLSWLRDEGAEPKDAIDRALPIEDETLRWATVGRIWRSWFRADAEAAQAWFDEMAPEMPEFYREKIPQFPAAQSQERGTHG